jgi:hypothetical protein
MMVALAHDVDEARKLLREKLGRPVDPANLALGGLCFQLTDPNEIDDLMKEPQIVDSPAAFYVYGGG